MRIETYISLYVLLVIKLGLYNGVVAIIAFNAVKFHDENLMMVMILLLAQFILGTTTACAGFVIMMAWYLIKNKNKIKVYAKMIRSTLLALQLIDGDAVPGFVSNMVSWYKTVAGKINMTINSSVGGDKYKKMVAVTGVMVTRACRAAQVLLLLYQTIVIKIKEIMIEIMKIIINSVNFMFVTQ